MRESNFKLNSTQLRRAFTMIELIIVVIIIGILAKTAISLFPDRKVTNDANYLSLQIMQKRENALNYDTYKFGEALWKIKPYSKEYNLTCIDLNITGQREAYGTSTIDEQEDAKNIQKHYHINKDTVITVSNLTDQNQTLCFDGEGRPYTLEQKLLKKRVEIQLSNGRDKKTILIFPYSGYDIIKTN